MIAPFPLLSRAILFVIMPLLLVGSGMYWWLTSETIRGGEVLHLEGKYGAVTIHVDDVGIPSISANNDLDVFYALGFMHAQERLWQMDMYRRRAAGELSEILGATSLSSDIFMKSLRLKQNAERMWANLHDNDKNILTHYVQGVNQGIAQLNPLPLEYSLLSFEPKPWNELDSLLWIQLMAVDLSSNLSYELKRIDLLRIVGQEKLAELMPLPSKETAAFYSTINSANPPQISWLPEFFTSTKSAVGSNSWVISGQHSASGKPMLANDPHLKNTVPSQFYLARLRGNKLQSAGASFPGLPFIVIGKNESIAWGLTNMGGDTQDLFLERINPRNQLQYEVDGQYQDMEVFPEEIVIRNDYLRPEVEPYQFKIHTTHHGPIISDVLGSQSDYAYSLRWTGADMNGGTFSSLLALNYAQDWTEFKAALSGFVAPIHNYVYADKQGNIGSIAPGAYPKRQRGQGLFPTIGWLSENDWQGWIAPEEWPQQYNPSSGIIVAANNRIIDNDYPYYVTEDWAPEYRATRIKSLLKSKLSGNPEGMTPEDLISIQLDTYFPIAQALQSKLPVIEATSDIARDVLTLVQAWDGYMQSESSEAVIVTAWLAHFSRLLIEDEAIKGQPLPPELKNLVSTLDLRFLEKIFLQGESLWCDYAYTESIESCDQLLSIALQHAIDELQKRYASDDPQDWKWSTQHVAQFTHFPFSGPQYTRSTTKEYLWRALFHRQIEAAGGNSTVNVAPASLKEETRFEQVWGPSYRQIIDWGEPAKGLFSIPTGQSGRVFSSHYDDQLVSHQTGGMHLLEATAYKREVDGD